MIQLVGFLGLLDNLMKVVVIMAIFVATASDNLRYAKSGKDILKALLDAGYSLINKRPL